MSKGFCGLHCLSTKKSAMTKGRTACQFQVNFNSASTLTHWTWNGTHCCTMCELPVSLQYTILLPFVL